MEGHAAGQIAGDRGVSILRKTSPRRYVPIGSPRQARCHSSGFPGCLATPVHLTSVLITRRGVHVVAAFTRLRPGNTNSLGASAVQNNNDCLQEDVDVEPDGPVSNIEEILRLLNLQIAVAAR
jgi:hypothetical protein